MTGPSAGLQKPNWGEVFRIQLMGIYPGTSFELYQNGQKFDFSKDLFPMLLDKGEPMYGYITDEYWCDIGNLQTYLQAHFDMLSGKVKFQLPAKKINSNVWIGKNVDIDSSVKLEGPCYIGDYTQIKKGAHIAYTVIGNYTYLARTPV